MKVIRLEFSSDFSASAAAVWAFHMRPDALEKLTPWWALFRIVDPGDGVAEGSLVKAVVGFWPFRMQWHALHTGVEEGRSFSDMAVQAPVRYWLHQHHIETISATRSRLRDLIWIVPPAWMPYFVARPLFNVALSVLFKWRHDQTERAVTHERSERQSFKPVRQSQNP